MKKIYIILITIFILSEATAQSCLPGGIIFEFQEQIDNFQTNFPGCTQIEGYVLINSAESITNLNGLSIITSIGGGLDIGNNFSLTNLTGLNSLTSIGGYLIIANNYALTSLSGLDSLTSIGEFFRITDNHSLTNLTGLNSLTSIGGDLEIDYNNSFTNLTGLDGLTSIGGLLSITYNDSLTNLTGLNSLTSIGELLQIENNNSLNNLMGLDNLISIGGYLSISDNDSLTNLMALNNLTSINGPLGIAYNEMLQSLDGLGNIDANSIHNLGILQNPQLSTCHVQSICDYLSDPWGTVEIYQNAIGCLNQEAVLENCLNYIDEENDNYELSVSPNPFSINTLIDYETDKPEWVTIKIFNEFGQQVHILVNQYLNAGPHHFVWSTQGLPAGTYLYQLTAGSHSLMGKMIVLK